jgi:UDP-N-acetylmuramate dehydrogenase
MLQSRLGVRAGERKLSELTTWAIGGPALVAEVDRTEQLCGLAELLRAEGVPWTVVGRGSNLLAADSGCDEVVVRLTGELAGFSMSPRDGGLLLTAGGGAPLPSMAGAACMRGAAGLAFAVGIPGTAGGGVFMNAGAYGGSLSGLVRRVRLVGPGGCLETADASKMGFGYRSSALQDGRLRGWTVASVELGLTSGEPAALRKRAEELLRMRRKKYPLRLPNAGSVFRRAEGAQPPGWLIERAGMKGVREGGAMVSPLHANFIVNTGGASSSDVRRLICMVGERVGKVFGVELRREVRFLGDP